MVLKETRLFFILKPTSWLGAGGAGGAIVVGLGACCAWSVRHPELPYIDGTTVADYLVCARVSLDGHRRRKK